MPWRELAIEQFNTLRNTLVIDVRSPCEHSQEAIPGSVNVPLLSDDERTLVGTMYKEQGELVARRHALTLIAPKIPELVEQIAQQRRHGHTVVVYCWRGGLRSESVCSVLSIAGLDCYRLTGGYKAWRAHVLKDFQKDAYPFEPIVLVGLTGTGKTEILRELHRLGAQVLDLESLANHRGSVFGGLGLGDQPTQKNFDAALWARLKELSPQAPVFLEGESRKVGRLTVPDCVFKRIQGGRHVLVTGSVQRRAQRIADDYLHPDRHPESELCRAIELLEHLRERLGSRAVAELKDLLSAGNVLAAVTIMLLQYYDPLYCRQIERCSPFELELSGDDVGQAAQTLMKWASKKELPPDKRGEGLVVVD